MNISEQTHRRVIAFVRNIANDCGECLRHTRENCSHCRSAWAKSILYDLVADRDNEQQVDCTTFNWRVETIKRILADAGRPLLTKEIDLGQTCSPQLKCWTLNQMFRKRMIERKFAFTSKSKNRKKTYFFYYLKNNKETK